MDKVHSAEDDVKSLHFTTTTTTATQMSPSGKILYSVLAHKTPLQVKPCFSDRSEVEHLPIRGLNFLLSN